MDKRHKRQDDPTELEPTKNDLKEKSLKYKQVINVKNE